MIDAVVFNNQQWEYNKELEELAIVMLEGKGRGIEIRIGKKVGRNDLCPCGTRLKYKKCCGK